LDLCLFGPEADLEDTARCQPAMFLAGMAGIEKLKGIKPASSGEMAALSAKLWGCMESYPPHMRDPFKMWGVVDEDGSGRIQYNELESFLRTKLKMTKKICSDQQLGALWLALDREPCSGFVDANEFMDFMRLGAPEEGETWKERLQKVQDAKGASVRQQLDELTGRDLNAKFADVTPMDKAEMATVAVLFHEQLMNQPVHLRDWWKMFLATDTDGSGRIQFDELEAMVRLQLHIKNAKLTDLKLQALWLAMDQDRSGFLDANDFGDFMRLGAPEREEETWQEKRHNANAAKGAEVRRKADELKYGY